MASGLRPSASGPKDGLVADLRSLGFYAMANALEGGQVDRAEALDHVRVRIFTLRAAARRLESYAEETVGHTTAQGLAEWCGQARAILDRQEAAQAIRKDTEHG